MRCWNTWVLPSFLPFLDNFHGSIDSHSPVAMVGSSFQLQLYPTAYILFLLFIISESSLFSRVILQQGLNKSLKTWFPLLSTQFSQGLLHTRCKNRRKSQSRENLSLLLNFIKKKKSSLGFWRWKCCLVF